MTQSFGEAATRHFSAASMLLGWRPQEFWEATPAELLSAFHSTVSAAEVPDAAVIAELQRQFPDR